LGFTGSAGNTASLVPGVGVTITTGSGTTSVIAIGQPVDSASTVTFASIVLGPNGSITFGDNTQQFTKAPRFFTNADVALGLTVDDMLPGDFYWDDGSQSIFILVEAGYLLDLTVRA
jgi:hypothetical protein